MLRHLQNRKIVAVLISLFLIALGYGVILPVLPFYTERLALNEGISGDQISIQVGWLTGIYPLLQLFFAPLWGRMSDKVGRKPLILLGLLGFVIMQLLTSMATSLLVLYTARIIGGAFSSALYPVGNAFISDLTSLETRAQGFALSGAAISLGVVLGPSIGGFLAQNELHFHFEMDHFYLDNYSVPFLFLAILGIIIIPVVALLIKRREHQERIEVSGQKSLASTFSFDHNKIGLLLFLSFLYQMIITLFESVFSLYAKNVWDYNATLIGIGFMICGLVMGILQPLVTAPKVQKYIPGILQIITGFALFGICLVLLIASKNQYTTWLLIAGLAAGGAFIAPNIITMISLREKLAGNAMGIQSSVNSFGQVIGPVVGTWVFATNPQLPYLSVGAAILLLALLLLAGRKKLIL